MKTWENAEFKQLDFSETEVDINDLFPKFGESLDLSDFSITTLCTGPSGGGNNKPGKPNPGNPKPKPCPPGKRC